MISRCLRRDLLNSTALASAALAVQNAIPPRDTAVYRVAPDLPTTYTSDVAPKVSNFYWSQVEPMPDEVSAALRQLARVVNDKRTERRKH